MYFAYFRPFTSIKVDLSKQKEVKQRPKTLQVHFVAQILCGFVKKMFYNIHPIHYDLPDVIVCIILKKNFNNFCFPIPPPPSKLMKLTLSLNNHVKFQDDLYYWVCRLNVLPVQFSHK